MHVIIVPVSIRRASGLVAALRRTRTVLLRGVLLPLALLALSRGIALAQGPITNGENHSGVISAAAEVDSWTFSANQGDYIALGIGEVFVGQTDTGFVPWMRLIGPTGTQVIQNWGTSAALISVAAPLSGTYTVLVASNDSGHNNTGSYQLTLAKVPGTFIVPAGDEGGPLSNGANHPGFIHRGDLDQWTFTAAQGEYISLSIGEVFVGETDTGFVPWIRLIGPTGTQVIQNWGTNAALMAVSAPLSGTYTVIVASNDSANDRTGNYQLTLAKVPGAFTVPGGDEGGPMTNGANHAGVIHIGDQDQWSFTAAQGEYISLSIGEVFVGETDPGFVPWIRLIGPTGAFVIQNWGTRAALMAVNAPLSGTYTVIVASNDSANDRTGNYRLTLAKTPGSFIVPQGDEGGAVTNGANHAGVIHVGDQDQWSFTAAQGEYISLSIGEVFVGETDPGFVPWIRLIGPTGAFVIQNWGTKAALMAVNAPLSGTYTVIVASNDSANDRTGNYRLTLAKTPGSFIVPPGDEGGAMTNGANHAGVIHVGDQDQWSFTAAQGEYLSLSIGEVFVGETDPGFVPWIRLIGPTGAFVIQNWGTRAALMAVKAPTSGTYTVIVASNDSANDRTGNYRLTLAKTPGPFIVPSDDEGGPMSNGVTYPGVIHVGDQDQWSFSAASGSLLAISVAEVVVGEIDPGFVPWIRLVGPTGALVTQDWGTISGQISVHAPATGAYRVIVASNDSANDATGHYTLSMTGASCSYALSQTTGFVAAAGGTGTIGISASCPWTAVSNSPFVTITSGASGSGDGSVSYSVTSNTSSAARVATINISGQTFTLTQAGLFTGTRVPNDFNHDGLGDLGVFRPAAGRWLIAGLPDTDWGVAGDMPVAGDFNGDGNADIAVFRPSNGTWYINGWTTIVWGAAGDIPVPGDYNGDGITEIAVFRPSAGVFYIYNGATVPWGLAGDLPVVADYNHDGRDDIAVYRPATGTWYVRDVTTVVYGLAADIPVPADYNGDGSADIAVFRPSTGTWFIRDQYSQVWGAAGDVPVAFDRNGDHRAELGVFRRATGTWYFKNHTTDGTETVSFGLPGDIPINRAMPPVQTRFGDYDGDRKADLTIFRPATGDWVSLRSVSGMTDYILRGFGLGGDVPVGRDYDGDGKNDFAVFRPSTGRWYILQSSTNYSSYVAQDWGLAGDIPVPGDYDGDGKADVAVFRPSIARWVILLSSTGNTTYALHDWGLVGDIAVPADYDGDGRTDVAVFRPSTGKWYILNRVTGAVTVRDWGTSGDVPTAADFDGDGKADVAVFRPSLGRWFITSSIDGSYRTADWGLAGDILVPADYNGDGKADVAVFRSSTGWWYVQDVFSFNWGLTGDIPALKNP